MLHPRRDEVVEEVADDLAEVDYGSWTGRTIKELLKEPLWQSRAAATLGCRVSRRGGARADVGAVGRRDSEPRSPVRR